MAKIKPPKPVTIDCETDGIKGRPDYPPRICGVSIKYWGQKPRYYAFGHDTNNNCKEVEAWRAVKEAYKTADGILCQNAKFDIDCIETQWSIKPPPWDKIHDTMFLLFLNNPHQASLSLKPSAELLLGHAPEERDAVGEWLLKNQPVPGVKISKSKQSPHYYMGYVKYAPGDIVGTYCNSDVDSTHDLFKLLWPSVRDRVMLEAYNRERELMPILLDMERTGVEVDLCALTADVVIYGDWQAKIDHWITKRLKVNGIINLDSGDELMTAMIAAGVVDPNKLTMTPTGKVSYSKENLLIAVTDKVLLTMLSYRASLKTCMSTFMKPWLITANRTGGRIHCYFNQVKSPQGDKSVGARTGRLSSTPNFLNLAKEFKPIWSHEQPDKAKAKLLPKLPANMKGLPSLPRVRSYIVPFPGEVLIGCDFSGQELRVLAHFEGGDMTKAYHDNPTVDLHQFAADLITESTGNPITRYDAKQIAFSIIYGSGIGLLAESLDIPVESAKLIKKLYLEAFPGIKRLQGDLKQLAKDEEPFTTVGSREYYCEQPKQVKGITKSYEYKMLNYLVQGSSADQTKAAMIKFFKESKHAKLILSVHDELVVSVSRKHVKEVMQKLIDCMCNAIPLNVPMLIDGEIGDNWADMKPFED
jgi:DNA polymerase-1